MRTIRVDEQVWSELEAQVEGFGDSPNAVLRRLLRLPSMAKDSADRAPRVARGRKGTLEKTAETEFRIPILRTLVRLGGQAPVRDVLDNVGGQMRGRLLKDDFGILQSTGELRWENNAKWARKHMIDDGLLAQEAPHGFWAITEAGRRYLQESGS